MEDDWASPWADADDRSSAEVVRNSDVKDAKDAGRAVIDVSQSRIPNSGVAAHTNGLWGNGEHGFGDSSAWASPSPAVGSGGIPGAVGGSGLIGWVGPVSPFVAKRAAEEETEPPGATGGEQPEAKKEEEWFGATDEADAWAAGSDWGDTKTVETSELNVNSRLSSEVAHEIKSPPGVNALIEGADKDGSARTEGHKEDQPTDAEILDNKPIEIRVETNTGEESVASETVSTEQVSPIPKTASVEGLVTKHVSGLEGEAELIEAEIKGEDDEEGEFGDFADEEYFEDAEENLSKDTAASTRELPPLPQTPSLKADIPFNIDTSLLNKLYPILTSYPEPPALEEIIHTTGSRKAWYRLTQTGTIRKDRSSDDDYVRVTWGGSKIQEDVNKIVARWMAEDRSTGGGVALGGSRRLGAMFGWGEGVEKKAPPAQLKLAKSNHSRQNSLASEPGVTKSPFGTSTTTHPPENRAVPSPQTASFGWSSSDNSQPTVESHPGSSSNSVKCDERLPSTPYRTSFQGTSSRMSSQPVTPSRSVVSHSPITSSHSSKLSHSLAATRPSSPSPHGIQGTAEVIATTPIISASMDSPLSSTPVAPTSVGQPESTTVSVPCSNFDEWGAFENIATTVKLPSATEANCNFDKWGSFEGLAKPVDSKPAGSISGQGQISALLQPPGAEQAICSNEDEWSAFAGPLPTQKTPTSDGLPEKSPAPTMKLGEQPGPKEQKIDGWGSLATSVDPLTSKPLVLEQPLVQPSAHALIESGLKSLGGLGPGDHKSDDWGSLGAFESSLTPKLPVSALTSARASEESNRRSVEAPSPKAHNTDTWGSFESFESVLTPKPKISNQPLGNLPTYISQENPKLAEKAIPKAQNIDAWDSPDGFETPQPQSIDNLQRPTPIISNSASTKPATSLVPPVLSIPVANGDDDDDDDDWGEMVQSPEIPRVNSPFSTVLQPTSLQPTLSHNNTPRTASPAPLQQQPQALTPSIPSAASMFDFGSFEKLSTPQKTEDTTSRNASGGNDTWDLSFFEGLTPSTSIPASVSAPVSSNQASSDLWDTPPPNLTGRRENVREMEESRLVNQVVEGLPDLSYMLQ